MIRGHSQILFEHSTWYCLTLQTTQDFNFLGLTWIWRQVRPPKRRQHSINQYSVISQTPVMFYQLLCVNLKSHNISLNCTTKLLPRTLFPGYCDRHIRFSRNHANMAARQSQTVEKLSVDVCRPNSRTTELKQQIPSTFAAIPLNFLKSLCRLGCRSVWKMLKPIFKSDNTYLDVVIWPCTLFIRHDHVLSFLSIYF